MRRGFFSLGLQGYITFSLFRLSDSALKMVWFAFSNVSRLILLFRMLSANLVREGWRYCNSCSPSIHIIHINSGRCNCDFFFESGSTAAESSETHAAIGRNIELLLH